MPAHDDNPACAGNYVWIKAESVTGDVTAARRSRSSQIAAHKRRYEKEHGITLEKITSSMSETHGFTYQTSVRYRIVRPDVATMAAEVTAQAHPMIAPKLTTIPTHLPPKRKTEITLNARQRRTQRRSGGYYRQQYA